MGLREWLIAAGAGLISILVFVFTAGRWRGKKPDKSKIQTVKAETIDKVVQEVRESANKIAEEMDRYTDEQEQNEVWYRKARDDLDERREDEKATLASDDIELERKLDEILFGKPSDKKPN